MLLRNFCRNVLRKFNISTWKLMICQHCVHNLFLLPPSGQKEISHCRFKKDWDALLSPVVILISSLQQGPKAAGGIRRRTASSPDPEREDGPFMETWRALEDLMSRHAAGHSFTLLEAGDITSDECDLFRCVRSGWKSSLCLLGAATTRCRLTHHVRKKSEQCSQSADGGRFQSHRSVFLCFCIKLFDR